MNKTIFLLISVAIFSLVLVEAAKATENRNEVLIILDVKDISETREIVDFIRSNGGEVAQVFIPQAIIGEISDELEQKILNRYSTGAVVIYHDAINISLSGGTVAQPAIRYWNGKFEPKLQITNIVNVENDPGPILNDALIPLDRKDESYYAIGTFSKAPPSDKETSEYMYGDILASIILLESNGSIDASTEDWGSTEETNVDNEIAAALNWWIARKPTNVNLTFWVYANHYKIPTSYEPINRPQSEQDLWIEEAMDYLGVPLGGYFSRVRTYDDTIRDDNDMDWAYTIFVVDSSNDADGEFTDGYSAYAYLNGPFMVMTYDNDGYGINNMDYVAVHETGHIFGAADQYYGAWTCDELSDCSSTFGYLSAENQNCEVSGCSSNVPSIMRSISGYVADPSAIDYYAKGQLGWRDFDGDGVNDAIDSTYNSDTDSDGDGVVDYWDNDDDSDGIIDTSDNCPAASGPYCNNGCPDTTSPNMTMISPEKNSVVKSVIMLNGTINESCALNSAEYKIDAGFWSPMALSGNIATKSINTSNYPDSSHIIYFRAEDEYGNAENTASITLTFDNTPPFLTITSPQNMSYNSKSILANVTLNEAGSWCGRSLDGTTNVTMNGSGTIWYNLMPSINDGSHNITFYCNDTVGNMNSTLMDFSVDATPPNMTIASPINGSVLTSGSVWFNLTTNENTNCAYQLSLCGASQSSSSQSVSTMSGGGGGGGGGCGENSPQNMSATGGKNHSQIIAGIDDTADGQNYRLTAACTDSAENTNSSSVRFYVDTKPPIITIYSPLNKSYNRNDLPINVSTNELVKYIKRSLDGGENITLCSSCKTYNSTTLTGLSEGKHNLTIYVADYVNNSASLTRAFIVDKTAPSINITSLVNGSKLTTSSVWVNATTDEDAACTYRLSKCAFYSGYYGSDGSMASIEGDLKEGESRSYAVGGKDYNVALDFVGSTTARFTVNGTLTNPLTEGDAQYFNDGISSISVLDIYVQDFAGGVRGAVFTINATIPDDGGDSEECNVFSLQNMTSTGGAFHSQLIGELSDTGTDHERIIAYYLVNVVCEDSLENSRRTSPFFYLDAHEPSMSEEKATFVTDSSANISWRVSELSNGTAEYGPNASYGNTAASQLNWKKHELELTGLEQGTLYHYRVRSSDLFGNENVSRDFTFRTAVAENIRQTIPANETTTVSSSATSTTLDIVVRGNVANVAINITSGKESPTKKSLNVSGLKYLNIDVDNSLSQVLASVMIKIHYTDEEVSAQNLTESSLGVYLYNSSLDEWVKLDSSMDWVFGTGVDETNNYVWANVSHFSSYGAGGLITNGYSCSSNSQCSSGLCSNNICSAPSSGGDSPPGGSSSGGGGSGGGGGGAAPLTSETVIADTILAGSTETLRFAKSDGFAVYEISITASNEKSGVSLKVSQANLASGASLPVSQSTGKVYKQLSINKQGIENEDIAKALVRFKVSNVWMINNSINPESVALYRYSGGSWETLPTKTISSDTKQHYYESESPGFSIFVIAGKFGAAPAAQTAQPVKKEEFVSGTTPESGSLPAEEAKRAEEKSLTGKSGEQQGLLGRLSGFMTGRVVAESGESGKIPVWPTVLSIAIILAVVLRWKKVKFGPIYLSWYKAKIGFKKKQGK